MGNIIFSLIKRNKRLTHSISVISFLLTLGLTAVGQPVKANPPESAPPELKNLLTQIDTAASKGDVKTVMQFYSPNFTHGDGLNRETMEKALTGFWQRYPQLRYTTRLKSWKLENNSIIAETVTTITGLASANSNSNNISLSTTITSRQKVVNAQIVQQDILSERTQLTSGKKPPQVDFRLPEQVRVNQRYNFDAIVEEPLGEDLLLGAALEEPIQPEKYLNPTNIELQPLSSGGLFKIGRAPAVAGNQWISAVIVRGGGMTIITQRLQVKR
jgi:hypothetical protein